MTLFFWAPLIALLLLAAALAALTARLAFGSPSPERARLWPERLARALNWASFLAMLALASGALDPFAPSFERSLWPTPLSLAVALGALGLGGALLFGPLRSASLGPRAACCAWLLGCAFWGADLAAESLGRALSREPRLIEGRLIDIQAVELRGAPRLSARFEPLPGASEPAAPRRVILPPEIAAPIGPKAAAKARLTVGQGPLGEPVALRIEPL